MDGCACGNFLRGQHLARGLEPGQEGKASQYNVTAMRASAIINAVQVKDQDVFAGYDDGRVLVWDASTGGREPKETLATLPDAVKSLWLYRQSHLIAVSSHNIMAWELSDAGIQLAWVSGLCVPACRPSVRRAGRLPTRAMNFVLAGTTLRRPNLIEPRL